MVTSTSTNIDKVARSFSFQIRKSLTPEQLVQANRENRKRNDGSCATHDFIDSNVCMNDAFIEVFDEEIDVQDEFHVQIANAAWDIAKAYGFNLKR